MKGLPILHITPGDEGYKPVLLLANRVNEHNSLHVIRDGDETCYTGGFIIRDSPETRTLLDQVPREKQYAFVWSLKTDPWVKTYYETI